jgi:hypothetical protein
MKISSRIVIAGVSTLVVAGGGTAAAAAVMSRSPVDSSGVIHGCWSNAEWKGSHVFVLQDAGTTCPKSTTAISWNQAGAPGPEGPAGPQGSPGAAGSGYEIYPQYWPPAEQDVAPGQTVTVTATCNVPEKTDGYVTGGGVVTYNGPEASNPPLHAADLRVIDSYPYPGSEAPNYNTGWTATVANESSSRTESFQTWAMCMYPTS